VCDVEPALPCTIVAAPVGVASEVVAPAPLIAIPSPSAKSIAAVSGIVVLEALMLLDAVVAADEPDAPRACQSQ
jgi:hypothetical protein